MTRRGVRLRRSWPLHGLMVLVACSHLPDAARRCTSRCVPSHRGPVVGDARGAKWRVATPGRGGPCGSIVPADPTAASELLDVPFVNRLVGSATSCGLLAVDDRECAWGSRCATFIHTHPGCLGRQAGRQAGGRLDTLLLSAVSRALQLPRKLRSNERHLEFAQMSSRDSDSVAKCAVSR
jgi:hypothetical protein